MRTVTVTSLEKFQNTVGYDDGKSFTIDEPLSFGGDDTGPDPYTLLLAAVGGCTSMTITNYARRKNWKLEKVTVNLQQGRVHAEDCADCETKTDAYVHEINITIAFEGDLTDEQRARLYEIAQKCPVKKTLTSEIKVNYAEAV